LDNLTKLYQQGEFNQIISLYPKLERQFYKSIQFYNLIGSSYFSLSDFSNAIKCFEKAINLNSNELISIFNLGSAYYELKNYEKSKKYFHNAIKIEPNSDYANYMLGNIYFLDRSFEESEYYLNRCLQKNPKNSNAYNILGLIFDFRNDLDQAEAYFQKSVVLSDKNFNALNNLGNIFLQKNNLDLAKEYYQKAININPQLCEAYSNMGLICSRNGNFYESYQFYLKALKINGVHRDSLINLSQILSFLDLKVININELEMIITRILDLKLYSKPKYIAPLLPIILEKNRLFLELEENIQNYEINNFLSSFLKLNIFCKFLKLCPIPSLRIENFLKDTREKILMNKDTIVYSSDNFSVIESIGINFFISEFVIEESDLERKNIRLLKEEIKNNNKVENKDLEIKILIISLYGKLEIFDYNLTKSSKFLSNIFKLHIDDSQKEDEIKKNLISYSIIDDLVSQNVKNQYEQNPYPRWQSYEFIYEKKPFNQILNELSIQFHIDQNIDFKSPQVLIAGCGTGQHAIESYSRYLNSKITCIDLSLSSLAYANRKAIEKNIKNIDFFHCDILEIKNLPGDNFDVIESSGVIHHMQNPEHGLNNLISKLKNGGFIKLGLYSKYAREEISDFRNLSKDDLKKIRNDLIKRNDFEMKNIFRWSDFFSLSEFRDLLVHVQEHQFDCIELKKLLSNKNLNFLGFEFRNTSIINNFKSIYGSESLINLEKWHDFESKNKNTFSGMYQFWCQKLNR
jgi:tetratricopeptide (TPR) repeat protein/SAM-dependent methyltransferase